MRLQQLKLNNWRRYRKFEHSFVPGITCISGVNGAGKSSLLDAIKYLLTGDWGDSRLKEENIRIGSTGEASVSGVFDHDGIEYNLTRGLRGTRHKLQYENRTETSAATIDSTLHSRLGDTPKGILETVFVAQGKISEFLSMTRVKWLTSVGSLCNVDSVEKIYAILGEQISADQSLAAVVVDDSDELTVNISELKQKKEEVTAKIAKVQESVLDKTQIATYERLLIDSTRHSVLSNELITAKTKLADFNNRYAEKAAAKEKYLAKLQAAISKLNKEQADLLSGKLATWQAKVRQSEEYTANSDSLTSLQMQLAEQEERATRISELLKAAQDAEAKLAASLAACRDQITVQEANIAQQRKEIADFNSGFCPTCGTKLKELPEFDITSAEAGLEVLTQQLAALNDQRKKLQTQLREKSDAACALLSDHAGAVKQLHATETQVRVLEKALKVRPPKRTVIDKYKQKIARAATLSAKLANYKKAEDKASAFIASVDKGVANRTRDINKITEQLKRLRRLPKDEEAQLRSTLAEHHAANGLLTELSSQLEGITKDIVVAENRLKKTKNLLRRCAAGNKWLADLSAWRDVVHRDCLQKVIVRSYLEECVSQINKKLRNFDCQFTIELDDELFFRARKSDGISHSAEILSGGQKVMLSVAYRMAINKHDLLVLDEPTAELDEHNVCVFRDFLRKIGSSLQEEGKQILLVTHDPVLLGQSLNHGHNVFDDVIKLTP